jgi:hypothetical protein
MRLGGDAPKVDWQLSDRNTLRPGARCSICILVSYQRDRPGAIDFGGGDNSDAKKVQIAVDRRKFLPGSAFLAAVGLKRADAQQSQVQFLRRAPYAR